MSCLPRTDSHIERKPAKPEVVQRTLQDPKKATSNHPLPRQPGAAVQPQEAHWLRPGQWVERSAAPFSRSKTKKKKNKNIKCKVSPSAQRQVWMVEGSGGAGEPIWHLPGFLSGVGQCSVIKGDLHLNKGLLQNHKALINILVLTADQMTSWNHWELPSKSAVPLSFSEHFSIL